MKAYGKVAAAGIAVLGAATALGGTASAIPIDPIHPTAIFVSTPSNDGGVAVVFNGAGKPVVNLTPVDPIKSPSINFNHVTLFTGPIG